MLCGTSTCHSSVRPEHPRSRPRLLPNEVRSESADSCYGEYLECSDDEETETDRESTLAAYEVLMSQIESPEEPNAYASGFNWDCGCDEMKEVIRHPLCDMGTALLIYWRRRRDVTSSTPTDPRSARES